MEARRRERLLIRSEDEGELVDEAAPVPPGLACGRFTCHYRHSRDGPCERLDPPAWGTLGPPAPCLRRPVPSLPCPAPSTTLHHSLNMSSSEHAFISPRKVILTKENLEAFQQSQTHETIVSYITSLNESIVGVKLTDEVPVSAVRDCDLLLLSLINHYAAFSATRLLAASYPHRMSK